MQLSFGPETEAFRDELIAFLDEHAPPEARRGFDYADADRGADERDRPASGRAAGRRRSSTTAG